jgi:NAD(P) transhydrogenase subunit alpha
MDISIGIDAILGKANDLLANINIISEQVKGIKAVALCIAEDGGLKANSFFFCLAIFILACFIGYFVVWSVTPALHSPLMAVTNAISSVIIVGAIIALGSKEASILCEILAFMAIILASINIFGGFAITQRMLRMFQKK